MMLRRYHKTEEKPVEVEKEQEKEGVKDDNTPKRKGKATTKK